jgi:hypothetical protein
MKIYWIRGDKEGGFAWFGHSGTWSEGNLCEKCGSSQSELIEPLLFEWNIGSDEIGDFMWSGLFFVVLDRVAAFMSTHGYDIHAGQVEVIGSERKRGYRNVPFPYTGPHLNWILANARVPLNELKSGVTIKYDCDLCGRRRYTFKTEGIVIDQADWHEKKMFRITQFGKSEATLVTDEARSEILEQGFTNVTFIEAGEII